MITTKEAMRPFADDVAAAPFLIAPERAEELSARLGKWGLSELLIVDGKARFVAMPGEDPHIRVSSAGLAGLWALSYVAYRFMDVGSRAAASPEGKRADQLVVRADPVFRSLVAFARRLYDADEAWPEDLPRPFAGAGIDTIDGKANTLFLAATSWVLLHEIAHMISGHSSKVSEALRLTQEEEADRFAVDWPLAQCPSAMQREFRVMAIIVALAWLFLYEQTSRGGGDHPAAIVRFWQAASRFGVPDDSPALENGFYALKAIFDEETAGMPADMSPRRAFEWIDDRLAELFPRG